MLKIRTCLILMILFSVSNVFVSSILARSQSPNPSYSCLKAIKDGESRLANIEGLKVVIPLKSWKNITKEYLGQMPRNRPWSYTYSFEGESNSIERVFASPRFMNVISSRIIQNCSSVSLVFFNRYASGRYVAYGLIQNEGVKKFACVPNGCYGRYGSITSLQWGMNCC